MTDHDNTLVPDVMLNGRWPLTLPRARAERAEWHTDAGWERARLDAMHDTIQPGDLVCYLGAECGDMPALVASWGADMVLVEPNWKAHEMIRAIFEANGLMPVAVFDGFAGDVCRKKSRPGHWAVGGWPDAAFNGENSPYDFRVIHQMPGIPMLTVDEIRRRLGRKIDHLSSDIEGAELRMLVGAEQTLTEDRPVCFLSVHPPFLPQYGDTAEELHAFMAAHGYVGTLLDTGHEEHWRYVPS